MKTLGVVSEGLLSAALVLGIVSGGYLDINEAGGGGGTKRYTSHGHVIYNDDGKKRKDEWLLLYLSI